MFPQLSTIMIIMWFLLASELILAEITLLKSEILGNSIVVAKINLLSVCYRKQGVL